MNFDRLTNISRKLTVGEINNSYDNDRKFPKIRPGFADSFLKIRLYVDFQ